MSECSVSPPAAPATSPLTDDADAYANLSPPDIGGPANPLSTRAERHWEAMRDFIMTYVRTDLGAYLRNNGRLECLSSIEGRVRDLVAPLGGLQELMALCTASPTSPGPATKPNSPFSGASLHASRKSRVVQVLRDVGVPLGAASFLAKQLLVMASSWAPGHVLATDLVLVLSTYPPTRSSTTDTGIRGHAPCDTDPPHSLFEVCQSAWSGASERVLIAKVLPISGAHASAVSRCIRPWLMLGTHRHVVQALFVRSLGDRTVLFTERVGGASGGGNLQEWMDSGKHGKHPLSLFDAMISMVWGLEFAHESGCLHLNLKPENVLVDFEVVHGSSFEFKLTDFLLSGGGTLSSYEHSEDPIGLTTMERRTTTTTSGSSSSSVSFLSQLNEAEAIDTDKGIDIDMKALVIMFIGIVRCKFLSDPERFQLLEACRTNNHKVINDVLRAALSDSPFPRAFLGSIRSVLWSCLTSNFADTGIGARHLAGMLLKSFEDAFLTKYMSDDLLPSSQPGVIHHCNIVNLAIAEYALGNYEFCMHLCDLMDESGGLVRGADYLFRVVVLRWRCGRWDLIEALNCLWAAASDPAAVVKAKPLEFFVCLILKPTTAMTTIDTGCLMHSDVIDYIADMLCEAGHLIRTARSNSCALSHSGSGDGFAISGIPQKQSKSFTFAGACLSSLSMELKCCSAECGSLDRLLALNIGSSFQCMLRFEPCGAMTCERGGIGSFPHSEIADTLSSVCKEVPLKTNGRDVWWSRDEVGDGVTIRRLSSAAGVPSRDAHVAIGQFLVAGNTAIFAHIVIGVEITPSAASSPVEEEGDLVDFFILVEGKLVSNNPFDTSSCDVDDSNSDTEAIQRAVTALETSPGVDNDNDAHEGIESIQLQEQHRPEYFLCRGVCSADGSSLVVTDINEVRSVYPDQRPVLFRMLLPSSPFAVIAGVGGLVGIFDTNSAYQTTHRRGNPSVTQLHTLSNDVQVLFNGSNKGSSLSGHNYQSCVTTVEHFSSKMFMVSGDDLGLLCLWTIQHKCSEAIRAASGGFELSSQLDLKSKIFSIRVSPSGSNAVVALSHSLLLVSILHESFYPHMYVKSVLDGPYHVDSVSYCFWYEGGSGESLEVWRASATGSCDDTVTIDRLIFDIKQRMNVVNDIRLGYLRVAITEDSDNLMQRVAQLRLDAHVTTGDTPAAMRVLQINRHSSTDLRCSAQLIEDLVSTSFGRPRSSGRTVISPVFTAPDISKSCQLFCIDKALGYRISFIAECIREAHVASSQQVQYTSYVRSLLPHLWASNAAVVPRDSAVVWHVAAGVVAAAPMCESPGPNRLFGLQPYIDLWDGALNEKIAFLNPVRALNSSFDCPDSHAVCAFCLSSDANFLAVVVQHVISKQQKLAIFRVHDSKVICTKVLKFEKPIRKVIWCLESRVILLFSDFPEPHEIAEHRPSDRGGSNGGHTSVPFSAEPNEQPSGWAAHRDRFLSALGLSSSQPSVVGGERTAAEINARESPRRCLSDDPFIKACISSSLLYFVDWEPAYSSERASVVQSTSSEQTIGHADGSESKDNSSLASSPATLIDLSADHHIDFFLSGNHTVRDVILHFIPKRPTFQTCSVPYSDDWAVLSAQIWLYERREYEIIGIVDLEGWSKEMQPVQRGIAFAVLNAFTCGGFSSFSCQPQIFMNSGCGIDEFSCLMYLMSQLMQSFKANYVVAIICSLIRCGLADCGRFLRVTKDSVSGYETPPNTCLAETVRILRSLRRDTGIRTDRVDDSTKKEYSQFVDSHSFLSIENWQFDLLAEFPWPDGEIEPGLLSAICDYLDVYGGEFIVPKPECMPFFQLVQLFVLEPLLQISAVTNLIEDRRLHLFFPLLEKDPLHSAPWKPRLPGGILLDEFEIPSRIDNMSMSQDSISIGADSFSMIETCSFDRSIDFESSPSKSNGKHSIVDFCATLCRLAIDNQFLVTVVTDSLKSSEFLNAVAEFESSGHTSLLKIDSNTKFEVEPILRVILESARGAVSDSEYLACLSYIRTSGSLSQTLTKFWKYLTTNPTVSISDFSVRDFEVDLFYSVISDCFRSSTPCDKYQCWFARVKDFLQVFCAINQAAPLELVASAIDCTLEQARLICSKYLSSAMYVSFTTYEVVLPFHPRLKAWLSKPDRAGDLFHVNISNGHNALAALFLRHCGNKSIAVDHPWHEYLRVNGLMHLRRSTRALRDVTLQVRKIDETCNIRGVIPYQIGFISGLQELYARRVGLCGRLPEEIGLLKQLRVLSMGNNRISGSLPRSLGGLQNLQRIVLHQNRLSGEVPVEFERLKCIINLAGNPRLVHGPDIPQSERKALEDFYHATSGDGWICKSGWLSSDPVAAWYKVGVLHSHVHSIVMSSNNMIGSLPSSICDLTQLRMIELATMHGLNGTISKQFCRLYNLRRLCICRCALRGSIPDEIGDLVQLEELQLFGNFLTGAIPDSIRNLTSLRLLSLGEYTGGNMFSHGPLPECISALRNLEALFIANCNVTGPLPHWLCNLKELRQLDLQRNGLTGHIPKSISSLTNLLYLNVKDNNGLTGPLPVDELSKMTRLNRLSLVHCSFENVQESSTVLQDRLPRCRIWV